MKEQYFEFQISADLKEALVQFTKMTGEINALAKDMNKNSMKYSYLVDEIQQFPHLLFFSCYLYFI